MSVAVLSEGVRIFRWLFLARWLDDISLAVWGQVDEDISLAVLSQGVGYFAGSFWPGAENRGRVRRKEGGERSLRSAPSR